MQGKATYHISSKLLHIHICGAALNLLMNEARSASPRRPRHVVHDPFLSPSLSFLEKVTVSQVPSPLRPEPAGPGCEPHCVTKEHSAS